MHEPIVHVRPVRGAEDQQLMQEHHYLGALAKIGHTLRYVAELDGRWVGLSSIPAPALKCAARDQWIGWDCRHQYDRLNLVANNSRFLILPGCHYKNLTSQILSRLRHRIQHDWLARFGYPLLMLETFVDPDRFHGTVYRASNWTWVGSTQGYRRTRHGYSERCVSPKLVFVLPLQNNARALLARPRLDERSRTGKARMKLTAEQMVSLYDFYPSNLGFWFSECIIRAPGQGIATSHSRPMVRVKPIGFTGTQGCVPQAIRRSRDCTALWDNAAMGYGGRAPGAENPGVTGINDSPAFLCSREQGRGLPSESRQTQPNGDTAMKSYRLQANISRWLADLARRAAHMETRSMSSYVANLIMKDLRTKGLIDNLGQPTHSQAKTSSGLP